MNEEQHLTYELGMTNVPSDATCDDNGLEESIGLTYADGEHRVIQKPVEYMTGLTNKTLLYAHKLSDSECYIVREGNYIKWGTKVNGQYTPAQSGGSDVVLFTASGDINISSIGKTLIITDDNAMHYFKWDGSKYKSIAFPIPGLGFSAKLRRVSGSAIMNSGKPDDILGFRSDGIKILKQEEYNELVVGLYSKNLKEVAQQKAFAEPFMVRAAYEMYDGSYINITNPILLFPSVTENTRFYIYGLDGEARGLIAVTQVCELFVRRSGDLSEYSDIIKDVVVFASKGVKIYKTNEDQPITNDDGEDKYKIGDSIASNDFDFDPDDPSVYDTTSYPAPTVDGFVMSNTTLRCLLKRNNKDITNDIEETSIFYKIASLGLKPITSYVNIASKIREDALVNLENQERLEYDDYFSRNTLVPKITYAYNSRLNLANVKRGFFHGFDFFMPLDDNDYHSYTFDVTIVTDAGEKKVRVVEPSTRQKQGIYFYYPDPRATKVTIYKYIGPGYQKILDANLKEHPFLNGAYYYAGVTPDTDEPVGTPASEYPSAPPAEYETLYNQIIQSEVNNPWLFLAKGYHTVGFSEIKGVSTITQALSQGQFGVYPLLVFSEEGIWAMSVDGTGLYNAIQPMSREVCSNAKGITQTDGAVFFPSEKGLMVVVGSDVRCVSEQLSGKSAAPFAEFLQTAVIAYDYRDGLLWIFDTTTHGTGQDAVTGSRYCWIYNIKSGTFARYDFGTDNNNPVIVTNVVNYYPDYLLQIGDKIYSLLNRPDINHDNSGPYAASIRTRAMKLGGGMTLKSIMRMKSVFEISGQNGSLSVEIWAKNNLNDAWVQLTHLRGVPHKYYQLRYTFTGLLATDRFAGTVLITQERRTNKLR